MKDYELKADGFLTKTGVTFKAEFLRYDAPAGTGNSIAEYRDVKECCSRCNGEGYLQLKNFSAFVNYCRHEGLRWREAMSLRKDWRTNGGEIQCPDCEDGIIIRRI